MPRTTMIGFIVFIALAFLFGWSAVSFAAEKSFYSPIIQIDKQNGRIVIADSGAVFWVDLPEEAKPHVDKLPLMTLVDIVVELRPDKPPLLKTWKVTGGESACKFFDGKTCH